MKRTLVICYPILRVEDEDKESPSLKGPFRKISLPFSPWIQFFRHEVVINKQL